MAARTRFKVGSQVKVWIGPPKQDRWLRGVITAIDPPGQPPGIEVTAEDGEQCYATHREVVSR